MMSTRGTSTPGGRGGFIIPQDLAAGKPRRAKARAPSVNRFLYTTAFTYTQLPNEIVSAVFSEDAAASVEALRRLRAGDSAREDDRLASGARRQADDTSGVRLHWAHTKAATRLRVWSGGDPRVCAPPRRLTVSLSVVRKGGQPRLSLARAPVHALRDVVSIEHDSPAVLQ
jgi:hypothetical protein